MLMASQDPKKSVSAIMESIRKREGGEGGKPKSSSSSDDGVTSVDYSMSDSSEEPSSADALEAAATAFVDAQKSSNPKAVATAFREMFRACENETYGEDDDI